MRRVLAAAEQRHHLLLEGPHERREEDAQRQAHHSPPLPAVSAPKISIFIQLLLASICTMDTYCLSSGIHLDRHFICISISSFL